MDIDLEFLKGFFETQIPIHKFLGMEILELELGYAKAKVPFRDEVIGDIRRRRWHGGIIATVMDSLGGVIGATYLTTPKDKLATIDFRIDYLKGAEAEPLVVEAGVTRLGKRILVVWMKAWNEAETELLAEGKGVYNFVRLKPAGEEEKSSQ